MELQTKTWEFDSTKKAALRERLIFKKSRIDLLRSFFQLITLFQKYIYKNVQDLNDLQLRNDPQVQSFLREKKLHKQKLYSYFGNQILNKFGEKFFGNLEWIRMMINLGIDVKFQSKYLLKLSCWIMKEVEKRKQLANK